MRGLERSRAAQPGKSSYEQPACSDHPGSRDAGGEASSCGKRRLVLSARSLDTGQVFVARLARTGSPADARAADRALEWVERFHAFALPTSSAGSFYAHLYGADLYGIVGVIGGQLLPLLSADSTAIIVHLQSHF